MNPSRAPRRCEPARSGARRRRHLRYALTVSAILVLAQFVGVLPVFRDRLQAHLNIGDREYGLLFSLGPLLGTGAVLAGGGLVARVGPVRVIRWCLLGNAASMLVLAAGANRWLAVLAGNTLCAVFGGPLALAINAYLTRLFPRERRRVLALSLAVGGAGGILMPLAGEGLLAIAGPRSGLSFGQIFRALFAALAALLALAACLYRGRRPRGVRAAPRHRLGWSVFLLPLPAAWLTVLMALHGSVDTTLYYWMPRFLGSGAFPRALVAPGLVMSGFSLAYLVSRALLTLLPERRGRRSLLILPGLLGGGALLIGILSRDFRLAAGGYVLGALLWSAEYPAMLGALASEDKHRFAAAMALSQVLTGPLTALLTYGIGHAAAQWGEPQMWRPMALAAGVFPLIGAAGAVWVLRFAKLDRGP